MRIPQLGIDKKALVILGAGASRGASCFEGATHLPPLDTDFFARMELLQSQSARVRGVLEFLKEEFGAEYRPRMEEYFTQLEGLNTFHSSLNITPGPRVKRYGVQLEQFIEVVAEYFGLIFREGSGHQKCRYHEALADALNADDTVVSFNYDCLMDVALVDRAQRSWNVLSGYGFAPTDGQDAWRAKYRGRGPMAKHSIRLLKLHGSLNWQRDPAGAVALRADPYEVVNRASGEIVPPVWNKAISNDQILSELWKSARAEFARGPVLVVIGYSVPETDQLSQALIRVSASSRTDSNKLKALIVINPDRVARERFVRLVKGALQPSTVIVELSYFKELAQVLE